MRISDQGHDAGEIAWRAMRTHKIAPTPRNFEIWYAYCSDDKPQLRSRIDALLEARQPVTQGVLEELYQNFFVSDVNLGAIQSSSRELGNIAAHLAGQISADRGMIEGFGGVLDEWHPLLDGTPLSRDLIPALRVVKTATAETSERLRALETLLAASVTRIGSLKQALARAEIEATRDSLTGLANRRMFDTALASATAEAIRGGMTVSLLMLDIDHFKKFNDTHGHSMGDNVLRLLAKVLTDHIKGRDTAARYGGEEFAIILLGATLPAAMTVGDQIRELLESRPLVNRSNRQKLGIVTCSIGAAVYRAGEAAGDLISRADEALYAAKRGGRNRVCAEAEE